MINTSWWGAFDIDPDKAAPSSEVSVAPQRSEGDVWQFSRKNNVNGVVARADGASSRPDAWAIVSTAVKDFNSGFWSTMASITPLAGGRDGSL